MSLREGWYEEYWSWVAVALFLLLTVDLLLTLLATAELGVAAEANPFVAWAIERGVWMVLLVNLAAFGLAVGMCWALAEMVRRTPARYRRQFARVVEAWLALLLVVGLFVFANNLSAIVLGRSLL